MTTKRVAITFIVTFIALSSWPALAAPKGTLADRIAIYTSCEAAGGSMKSCCEKAGGTYSQSTTTSSTGKLITIESCGIMSKVFTRQIGKLGSAFTAPGVQLRAN